MEASTLDRATLVEAIAEVAADLAAATAARDATPTASIERLSKVKLAAHYDSMLKLLQTRLRIFDAEPRA